MSRLTMAAIAGLALMLTGCGSVPTTGGSAPAATRTISPPVQRSLPPTPAGNVLTFADNGATVTLVTGQLLTIELAPAPLAPAWDRPRLTGSGLRLVSVTGGYPEHGPMRAVFLAVAPGTTVVTAASDMACLHAHPRCMVAQRIWTARVIIRAHL